MNQTNFNLIKQKLKHVWSPFFSRFGKLTNIQLKTIPQILDGKNVVVISPTASGKTEAVIAPIAERFILENWQNLCILYIVPTRALANDTFFRIYEPLYELNIKTEIKHSDVCLSLTKTIPNLLITTPESLDSIICRYPNILLHINTVIIDEIHLLDNTYRGDQLRSLLLRLKEIAENKNFNIHLLSATISDPINLAKRYVKEFEIVEEKKKRQVSYQIFFDFQTLYNLCKKKGWKKILCFCNMREKAESIANEISPLWSPYPVVIHHGSLSKNIRKEAESIMKESDVAVCVATSTLEVGIDIGDIDLVILAEIPWSLSSLIQRIGRGNRKSDIINVAAMVSNKAEEKIIKEMFKAIVLGFLPEESYIPDKSVVIQQIFSYLFQKRQGVDKNTLYNIVSPLCTLEELEIILNSLKSRDLVEYKAQKWFATSKILDLGEGGLIHSNIPDERNYKVIDIDSNKEIGYVGDTIDEIFILGGKIWKVVSKKFNVIEVKAYKGKANSVMFKRYKNFGKFFYLLPDKLKKLILNL